MSKRTKKSVQVTCPDAVVNDAHRLVEQVHDQLSELIDSYGETVQEGGDYLPRIFDENPELVKAINQRRRLRDLLVYIETQYADLIGGAR
jgi:hypothetical protein